MRLLLDDNEAARPAGSLEAARTDPGDANPRKSRLTPLDA
jgi:hypothetical protein